MRPIRIRGIKDWRRRRRRMVGAVEHGTGYVGSDVASPKGHCLNRGGRVGRDNYCPAASVNEVAIGRSRYGPIVRPVQTLGIAAAAFGVFLGLCPRSRLARPLPALDHTM